MKNDKYSLVKAFAFCLFWAVLWGMYDALKADESEELSVTKNIHFNLVDVDEEKITTAVKQTRQSDRLFSKPILTIQVQKTPPAVWENISGQSYVPPTPKKTKIKTRPTLETETQATADTSAGETSLLPSIHPGYFGEAYDYLLSTFIVLIDRENLGRNNSYFAIWDKNAIEKSVKNSHDETNCARLMEVFSTGDVASKRNSDGIKFLTGMGFFEIKKTSIAARIFGEKEVVEKGRKALVFEHYSRCGLH